MTILNEWIVGLELLEWCLSWNLAPLILQETAGDHLRTSDPQEGEERELIRKCITFSGGAETSFRQARGQEKKCSVAWQGDRMSQVGEGSQKNHKYLEAGMWLSTGKRLEGELTLWGGNSTLAGGQRSWGECLRGAGPGLSCSDRLRDASFGSNWNLGSDDSTNMSGTWKCLFLVRNQVRLHDSGA